MNRFTGKIDNDYIVSVSMGIGGYTDAAEEKQYEANQKLGQLEDIEEELGIDLITLFKALQNDIWLENVNHEIIGLKCYLIRQPKSWILRIADGYVFPKDHLKTWWLFEELSEEQKSKINYMFKKRNKV